MGVQRLAFVPRIPHTHAFRMKRKYKYYPELSPTSRIVEAQIHKTLKNHRGENLGHFKKRTETEASWISADIKAQEGYTRQN